MQRLQLFCASLPTTARHPIPAIPLRRGAPPKWAHSSLGRVGR